MADVPFSPTLVANRVDSAGDLAPVFNQPDISSKSIRLSNLLKKTICPKRHTVCSRSETESQHFQPLGKAAMKVIFQASSLCRRIDIKEVDRAHSPKNIYPPPACCISPGQGCGLNAEAIASVQYLHVPSQKKNLSFDSHSA
jgi:hypothetical protein